MKTNLMSQELTIQDIAPEKRKLDTTAILDGSSLNKHKTAKNVTAGH